MVLLFDRIKYDRFIETGQIIMQISDVSPPSCTQITLMNTVLTIITGLSDEWDRGGSLSVK